MKPLLLAIGLLGAVTLSTQCCAQIFDDPFSQYLERSLTITPGAGNDQGVNAAIRKNRSVATLRGLYPHSGSGTEGCGLSRKDVSLF